MALPFVKDSINGNFEVEALKGTNRTVFYCLYNSGHNTLSYKLQA